MFDDNPFLSPGAYHVDQLPLIDCTSLEIASSATGQEPRRSPSRGHRPGRFGRQESDDPILTNGRLYVRLCPDGDRILLEFTTGSQHHYLELLPPDVAWLIQALQEAIHETD
jgi:hypothetical protein